MREPERVAEALPRLRAHGIRSAVDDFGGGRASLVNLRRLAPDELKIYKSFVASLLNSRSDQAIVTAIVGLAHELGATVSAEGIEVEATQRWLADAGCDVGQGFGIARPMTAEEFTQLIAGQAANGRGQQRTGKKRGVRNRTVTRAGSIGIVRLCAVAGFGLLRDRIGVGRGTGCVVRVYLGGCRNNKKKQI